MRKKIVVIGIGGVGRDVVDLIDACNKSENMYEFLGFIVDQEYGEAGTIINDAPILGGFKWLEKNPSKVSVVVAIGQPHLRLRVVKRVSAMNCKFENLIHPWTKEYMHKWVSLGEGVILNGCQTSNLIRIGNHAYINALSIIGHDSTIGDFCTLAPGVHIDGYVNVGEGCFLGTGCNILPNVSIGEWSVIGAGSVISKDIPANSSALILPPRIMSQREPGWHLDAS